MSRPVALLCVSVFLSVLGTGIVAPLLAPYAKSLGASGIVVGLIFSSFYSVRLLIGTPVGKWADRHGPASLLRGSMMLYPFIAIVYWLSHNLLTLFAARLLHGFASAMLLPMVMAVMGELSPEGEEGRYMGYYNTVLFFGNAMGPLLGGLLAERYGTRVAFVSLFCLAVLAFGTLLLTPNERRRCERVAKEEQAATRQVTEENNPKVRLWRTPELLGLGGINIVIAVLSVFMVSFFTLFAASRGIRLSYIGVLIAVYGVMVGALQIPFGRLADRVSKKPWIFGACVASAMLLGLFPFVSSIGMMIVLLMALGVAVAITLSFSSALGAMTGRRLGMGKVMGFLGSMNSVGMIAGPLFSGWLSDHLGVGSTCLATAGLLLAGAVCFVMMTASSRVS